MDLGLGNTLLPGDPRLIDHIVGEVKSQGIFDQFRKDALADVDTKPAYQNLRTRVEGSVNSFLDKQVWKADLNKNQLRETLRKHISDGAYLDAGVERIVDQVVNPKIYSIFMPQVEDVVYKYLGLEKPKREKNGACAIKDLLPVDLDPVSPESDKNSLKDVSLDSADTDLLLSDNKSKKINQDIEETHAEVYENSVKINLNNESNKVNESSEKPVEDYENRLITSTPPTIDSNLVNDLIKSDDKTEEEEEDSPVFEPIDIMNFNESNISNDSHLSGISELTSHRSRSPDFANEFSRDNFDFSNQDSQFSKVSSDSRLSIVTDFGSSNPASTPLSDSLKEDANKEKVIKDSKVLTSDDDKSKEKEVKTTDNNKVKDNIDSKDTHDTKSLKSNSFSKETSRDTGDSGSKDKAEHKEKEKSRSSSKSKSSKERSNSRDSRSHRDKNNKRKSSSSDNKNDTTDKSKDKENSREANEKTKEKEKENTSKSKESSGKEQKDLKDIYKEKIRELREKKELTEKEKLNKDNKESKSSSKDNSKDKKSSSSSSLKDKKDERSSSSNRSHSFSRHESSKNKSSSSSKDDTKSSRSSSKDKSKKDEKHHSKDSKSKSSSDSSEKRISSKSDKDDKKSSQRSSKDSRKESRSESHSRSSDKSESRRSESTDSKDRKHREEKKSKPKDDHGSSKKSTSDRRSSDRDGSSGSNGKGSKSSSSSSSSSTKPTNTNLSKESSNTSNESSETSDGVDESQVESTHTDNNVTHCVEMKDIECNKESHHDSNSNLKRIDLGHSEFSLPLKKRPLQSDTDNSSTDYVIKKRKLSKSAMKPDNITDVSVSDDVVKNKETKSELNKTDKNASLIRPVDVENTPIVPDDERVQIIEVKDEEDDEPYPEVITSYLESEQPSSVILEVDSLLNSGFNSNPFSSKSKLSEMELSIRQSLNEMMSDSRLDKQASKNDEENTSDAEADANRSKRKTTQDFCETGLNNKTDDRELVGKAIDALNVMPKTENNFQVIEPKISTVNKLSDDEEDCLYFLQDNERLNKFNEFLRTLEQEENLFDEEVKIIMNESKSSEYSNTMAPPLLKRKYSTSPLSDIVLNNSDNNNEVGHANKINAATMSDEEGAAKKKKVGRPKKQRPSVSSSSPQSVTNGEHFVMPLSPDSDVSATSEKMSLNHIKEDKSRQRNNNQRYSSDDLYKPRPLFVGSSRRSRRSDHA